MPVATGPVTQSTSQKPATSVAVITHQHSVTGSRPTSQLTVSQSVTGTSDIPDYELQYEYTSPVYPEEEGKDSDREADIPQQD